MVLNRTVVIRDIKQRIQTAQIKAAVTVNQELLRLYWDMAERMVAKQEQTQWGDGFIKQMSVDLHEEFPGMKGFSERNLKYIRQWYQFFRKTDSFGQQLVAQIPWGHNIAILSKCKNTVEAVFYIQKTIQNNWSRAVLIHHMKRRPVLFPQDSAVSWHGKARMEKLKPRL
jgi:predicted nuclease of restriction endonuclease-like (RecB) superfamily